MTSTHLGNLATPTEDSLSVAVSGFHGNSSSNHLTTYSVTLLCGNAMLGLTHTKSCYNKLPVRTPDDSILQLLTSTPTTLDLDTYLYNNRRSTLPRTRLHSFLDILVPNNTVGIFPSGLLGHNDSHETLSMLSIGVRLLAQESVAGVKAFSPSKSLTQTFIPII
ncbi:hypothetical protein Tco_0567339 [Tanacetum coccineum]